MFNKVILIGYVIQNVCEDAEQLSNITLETHSELGNKRQKHDVVANKRLYDVAREIATPGELVRVEGVLTYNSNREAKIFAHNLGIIKVNP